MTSRSLVALLVVALAGSASCTVVGATTGGLIAYGHNRGVADDQPDDRWSTSGAIGLGALVGAVVDLMFLQWMGKQWSRPLT